MVYRFVKIGDGFHLIRNDILHLVMYVIYKKRSSFRCGLFYLNIQTYKLCCLLVYCLLFKTEVREWTDKWSWSIYCLLDQRDYTSFSSKYGLDTEVQNFYEIIKSRTMKFFITTNLDDIKCWTRGRGQTNNPNMLKEKHSYSSSY